MSLPPNTLQRLQPGWVAGFRRRDRRYAGQEVSYCRANGRLAEIPKFTLSLNGEVRQPVGALTAFLRGAFTLRPAYSSELLAARAPAQERLDLFLGPTGPDNGWELSLWSKNVFNQQVSRLADAGVDYQLETVTGSLSSGYRALDGTLPREVGLTARMNF